MISDVKKWERLRRVYETVQQKGVEVVRFEGEELHIPYVKYLLQYLDDVLSPRGTVRQQYVRTTKT